MGSKKLTGEHTRLDQRVKDNEKHAKTIQRYWLARGYDIEVRATYDGEIISSTRDGKPSARTLPRHAGQWHLQNTDAEKIDQILDYLSDNYAVLRGQIVTYDRDRDATRARHHLFYILNYNRKEKPRDIAKQFNIEYDLVIGGVRSFKRRSSRNA
jgi:hypothetical protein